MDKVLEKLSEIENASQAVMEGANERKKSYARDMEKKTAAFDALLESQTAERIAKVRADMEADMNERLDRQRQDAQDLIRSMEENYEKNHKAYAEAIFQKMIKG